MKLSLAAAAGAVTFLIGLAKAMHTNATADPFAAFWCRPAVEGATNGGLLSFVGHCWGCPVAFVGAGIALTALGAMAIGRRTSALAALS